MALLGRLSRRIRCTFLPVWQCSPALAGSCGQVYSAPALANGFFFFRMWEMERAPRAIAGTQQELVLNTEFPGERGCSSTLDNHPSWGGWE